MKVEIKHLLLKSIQLKNAHDTAALNNALLTSIRTSRPASRFHEAIQSGKFLPPLRKSFSAVRKKMEEPTDEKRTFTLMPGVD